ncbi:hypothetical protein PCE1_004839 [Barthelona sp. PCE]
MYSNTTLFLNPKWEAQLVDQHPDKLLYSFFELVFQSTDVELYKQITNLISLTDLADFFASQHFERVAFHIEHHNMRCFNRLKSYNPVREYLKHSVAIVVSRFLIQLEESRWYGIFSNIIGGYQKTFIIEKLTVLPIISFMFTIRHFARAINDDVKMPEVFDEIGLPHISVYYRFLSTVHGPDNLGYFEDRLDANLLPDYLFPSRYKLEAELKPIIDTVIPVKEPVLVKKGVALFPDLLANTPSTTAVPIIEPDVVVSEEEPIYKSALFSEEEPSFKSVLFSEEKPDFNTVFFSVSDSDEEDEEKEIAAPLVPPMLAPMLMPSDGTSSIKSNLLDEIFSKSNEESDVEPTYEQPLWMSLEVKPIVAQMHTRNFSKIKKRIKGYDGYDVYMNMRPIEMFTLVLYCLFGSPDNIPSLKNVETKNFFKKRMARILPPRCSKDILSFQDQAIRQTCKRFMDEVIGSNVYELGHKIADAMFNDACPTHMLEPFAEVYSACLDEYILPEYACFEHFRKNGLANADFFLIIGFPRLSFFLQFEIGFYMGEDLPFNPVWMNGDLNSLNKVPTPHRNTYTEPTIGPVSSVEPAKVITVAEPVVEQGTVLENRITNLQATIEQLVNVQQTFMQNMTDAFSQQNTNINTFIDTRLDEFSEQILAVSQPVAKIQPKLPVVSTVPPPPGLKTHLKTMEVDKDLQKFSFEPETDIHLEIETEYPDLTTVKQRPFNWEACLAEESYKRLPVHFVDDAVEAAKLKPVPKRQYKYALSVICTDMGFTHDTLSALSDNLVDTLSEMISTYLIATNHIECADYLLAITRDMLRGILKRARKDPERPKVTSWIEDMIDFWSEKSSSENMVALTEMKNKLKSKNLGIPVHTVVVHTVKKVLLQEAINQNSIEDLMKEFFFVNSLTNNHWFSFIWNCGLCSDDYELPA